VAKFALQYYVHHHGLNANEIKKYIDEIRQESRCLNEIIKSKSPFSHAWIKSAPTTFLRHGHLKQNAFKYF